MVDGCVPGAGHTIGVVGCEQVEGPGAVMGTCQGAQLPIKGCKAHQGARLEQCVAGGFVVGRGGAQVAGFERPAQVQIGQ